MKRVDLDSIRKAAVDNGLSRVNTDDLESMIHELRLLRELRQALENELKCKGSSADVLHALKALEEME